ncbi:MAG: signal recognition particle-docking protein FtsY [Brevibacterium sp.]|uniref:signal recognition particle-docking protein FtsY n=1 Tax=Brevibacterium sp. TaxID=1701 RepID=UPI0026488400|nr:signal recognition particle-docking protein FtsY [Brevibacterium sp.]MDN5808056.1 signal recognition particle-docking protein FtsY [Brevibacterium sp.]MDN5833331.1 signal recognition particle-docking protein FtsY [Brevibacterium sp.]MDN5877048.1 signal recognition particle-docking protein FtsY [Brevibacterium sp.]MDN5908626.1 signal recognition particle-docking protein FtsY [Brevibacterium sp.]MDN6123700.1 signal recognition particle-docking protein FtsY [Brevibacterium sp.]
MDQPIVLLIVAAIVFILVVGVGFTLRINAKRKGLRDKRSIDADVTGELTIDEISEAVVKEKAATRGSETPTEPANRLVRLRERLAKSNTGLGRGLLSLLSRDTLDESTWEEIEDTLILADVGVDPTTELVDRLRERVKVLGTREPEEVRALLREELLNIVDPTMDRELATASTAGDPAVMLVVGVNGAGKTTTVGKIARVLVAEDQSVLLGAADTFRAAAAEQLTTWGSRVGVETVRGEEGADPASVAYSAVERGKVEGTDVVLIDTAGRLQNKIGLMDELGKVKRVATRPLGEGHEIDEVLLVLDATTGQNGMQQAKVFAEAVNITGIVLTKLDGTAKGGIVVAVQRELGVPVKLIGLGEGADDLAPFTAEGFVDALLD